MLRSEVVGLAKVNREVKALVTFCPGALRLLCHLIRSQMHEEGHVVGLARKWQWGLSTVGSKRIG